MFQFSPSDEIYFNGAFAGGQYWHGFSVPRAGDVLHFSAGGTAPGFPARPPLNPLGQNPSSVFFGDFNYQGRIGGTQSHWDAVNATVARVIIHNGSYEFNFGSGVGGWAPTQPAPSQGSLRITDETHIADLDGQSASLAIRQGTLTSNGVYIAKAFNSTGTVDVRGQQARWSVGAWLDVGSAGLGTLNVANGAHVTAAGALKAGVYNGSTGRVNVSGGGVLAPRELILGEGTNGNFFSHGTLSVIGTGSSVEATNVFVGATGSGDADIRNGAHLSASSVLRVGSLAQGGSELLVSGASASAQSFWVGTIGQGQNNACTIGGDYSSLLSVADEIIVGSQQAGGRLNIGFGGLVSSARGYVGIESSPNGGVSITDNGAWNVAGELRVGRNHGSGSVTVNHGTVTAGGFMPIGEGGGAGTVLVTNGGSLHANDLAVADAGVGTSGSLTVSGTGTTVASDFTVTVGAGPGGADPSHGMVSVSDHAALSAANAINVGFTSRGSMSVTGGGSVQSAFGRVGRISGSEGTVSVSGTGSRWDTASTMFVGGHTATGEGGSGLLQARAQGLITVGTTLESWSQGVVDARSGGRILVGPGNENLVLPGTLRIVPGGTLAGNGHILGRVVNAGGIISPGHSAGTLVIEDELINEAGSVMAMEIGGTVAGAYDQINLLTATNLTLDGLLRLTFVDNFAPRAGDVFNLLLTGDATVVHGAFASVDVQNLLPGWSYSVELNESSNILQVHSLNDGTFIPAPSAVGIVALIGLLRIRRRRQVAHVRTVGR
ncbi:MAG: hypothetical protein JSR77_05630 [Planctomycetes bacterium]|nr:hypothetical protein [Planctomycetota bacterium]